MNVSVIPIKEAAKMLGVRRETVSDLLDKHRLPTETVPFCGRARGVGPEVFARLQELLTPEPVGSN